MHKIVEVLKNIFDFALATVAAIAIFSIIFSGVLFLGDKISYYETIYPTQKYAFIAAYAVKYFMLLLDVALLVIFLGKEFWDTVKLMFKKKEN